MLLDDPEYEMAAVESRLVNRHRFADDIALVAQVKGRKLSVGDRDHAEMINVASDKSFLHSPDRLGFISLVVSPKS
jgi:hypothetical protein